MHRARRQIALDRRRFITGAVASAAAFDWIAGAAQDVPPTPTPIRIQTPDLAFVEALQTQLATYQATHGADNLVLSIVTPEPASDSLLNDLRLRGRRFSAAFVPNWLIPDLVRDGFIVPASPPPSPLPPAIAQLRSFGGEWVATDFDHDCDLLYVRTDLMPRGVSLPETWTGLLETAELTGIRLAIPQTHAQQAGDHFCSMAASTVGAGEFWFDPESMDPMIASPMHEKALETWKGLSSHSPEAVRSGSTGDLWKSFLDGESAALVASADFLPFALQRSIEPAAIVVTPLPGTRNEAGEIQRSGNATGANWGGVTVAGVSGGQAASGFLDYLAEPAEQRTLVTDLATGITPTASTRSSTQEAFIAGGWPANVTSPWLEAIAATHSNPTQLLPLRIAETRRYLMAYERRIVAYLDGEVSSATETLEAAAEDWRAINDAIGVETQRDLFRRSRMAPPAQ